MSQNIMLFTNSNRLCKLNQLMVSCGQFDVEGSYNVVIMWLTLNLLNIISIEQFTFVVK